MIYPHLPNAIFKVLFGDRRKFGTKPNYKDDDWLKWQENYIKFYVDNQKGKIGSVVNHFGFKIMSSIDIQDKIVLEVGPGRIEHLKYNSQKPANYILADINEDFLTDSKKILVNNYSIDAISTYKVVDNILPFESESVDAIISFHQLEHINDLDSYLDELLRILKPGGILAGAVPCEGGIAWGLGRYLTSRKYVSKKMNFNYDKIICWEHPNFVNRIKSLLDSKMRKIKSVKKPFRFLPFDCNLSWSFVYQKLDSL